MTRDQCKFLLRARRPDGADARDPMFREALARVASDPGLAAWFERERAFDHRISAALATIDPPAVLRARILAGIRAGAPRRPRRLMANLAAITLAAACVALAFITLRPRSAPPMPLATIVELATAESGRPATLDHFAASSTELAGWLERAAAPTPAALPGGLRELATIGCRVYSWNGVRASLVCFRSEGAGGGPAGVLHLFVVDSRSCAGGAAEPTPVVYSRSGHAVATWRDEARHYVLVAPAGEEALRRLLLPPEPRLAGLRAGLALDKRRPGALARADVRGCPDPDRGGDVRVFHRGGGERPPTVA